MAKKVPPPPDHSNALLAGVVGTSLVSNAGGTTITTCPPNDESFYCKFVKGFNMFKMILYMIVVFVIIFILYKIFAK